MSFLSKISRIIGDLDDTDRAMARAILVNKMEECLTKEEKREILRYIEEFCATCKRAA